MRPSRLRQWHHGRALMPQVFFLKGSVEGVGFRGLGKSGLCKTFVEAYRVQGIRG